MSNKSFSGLILFLALITFVPQDLKAKEKKATPSKAFTITGNIAGMPPVSVVLEMLRANDSLKVVDSQRSDMAGHFVFKGSHKEDGLYRLRFSPEKFVLLSVDKGDVTVTSSWPITAYEIKGSTGSTELQGFVDTVVGLMGIMNRNNSVVDSLKKSGNQELAMQAAKESQQVNVQFRDYIKAYSIRTKYEPNAIIALRVLNPQEDIAFYNKFAGGLDTRFPGTVMTKEFNQFMTRLKEGMPEPNEIGDMAPDLTMVDTSGKTMKLSGQRGKYVLLDFWASWCGPCRAENPNVLEAFKQYRSKNFTIFAVSLDTKKDQWIGAVRKDALLWPQVSDLKGWQSPAAAKYGVRGIPMNFLIDPTGKIIAKNLRGPDLEKKLGEVLK